MKASQVLTVILALFRHFMSAEVITAIKTAAVQAIMHGEWSHGEKTEFVIQAGRDVVAATSTPWDDMLYEAAVSLYLRKYAARLQEKEPPVDPTPTERPTNAAYYRLLTGPEPTVPPYASGDHLYARASDGKWQVGPASDSVGLGAGWDYVRDL